MAGGVIPKFGLQPKSLFWLKPIILVITIPALNGRETKIL
jgi:hypothetical protein